MPDTIQTFRHFREVPEHAWRWPNFSPAEIACRGTGKLKLHHEALDRLQALGSDLRSIAAGPQRRYPLGSTGKLQRIHRNEALLASGKTDMHAGAWTSTKCPEARQNSEYGAAEGFA